MPQSIKMNLVFLIGDFIFPERKKKACVCTRNCSKGAFLSKYELSLWCSFVDKKFFRILSGSNDLRKTEATCKVQSKIIRNNLSAKFSLHS